MTEPFFVDSNVLVYAFDEAAGDRHDAAAALIEQAWETRLGVLSTQVLQEFYHVVTHRLKRRLEPQAARQAVEAFSLWHVEVVRVETILRASAIAERYHLSFWDGLIVAAAAQAGAKTLVSEDFQDGARLAGVRVRNPFAKGRRLPH